MPLDVGGRMWLQSRHQHVSSPRPRGSGKTAEPPSCKGLDLAILAREQGIPSKHVSPAHVEQVPALCTHRPSQLPIGGFSEALGMLPG